MGSPVSRIFCISEDVISTSNSKMVNDSHLKLFKAPWSAKIHSHCFYLDDLMVYYNYCQANLTALKNLFTRYTLCSRQGCMPLNPQFMQVQSLML